MKRACRCREEHIISLVALYANRKSGESYLNQFHCSNLNAFSRVLQRSPVVVGALRRAWMKVLVIPYVVGGGYLVVKIYYDWC